MQPSWHSIHSLQIHKRIQKLLNGDEKCKQSKITSLVLFYGFQKTVQKIVNGGL